jgi:hypothetical protein
MILNPIDAIRAALLYSRARSEREKGQFVRAEERLTRALALLGGKSDDPRLFYVHILAAEIGIKLGHKDAAFVHANTAVSAIEKNSRLGSTDQAYLLDYCGVLLREAGGSDTTVRLSADEYGAVSSRFRRQYPLLWDQPAGQKHKGGNA